MISNSQSAMEKATELINHYSQFLPEDYFEDNEDDDYDEEKAFDEEGSH